MKLDICISFDLVKVTADKGGPGGTVQKDTHMHAHMATWLEIIQFESACLVSKSSKLKHLISFFCTLLSFQTAYSLFKRHRSIYISRLYLLLNLPFFTFCEFSAPLCGHSPQYDNHSSLKNHFFYLPLSTCSSKHNQTKKGRKDK